jgi:ATP adenylyltransferase/5',5'''-P-1,P-4-tetraphosphate phosphorylase II
MQIIPFDVLFKIRKYDATHALPIDDIIGPEIGSGRWKPLSNKGSNEIYTIPEFPFKHAIANIYTSSQWESLGENVPHGVYLESVYNTLLESTGVTRQPCSSRKSASPLGIPDEFCIGYNAVMTSTWMMIVPRSQREFKEGEDSVGVNGFGFVGLLLGRNEHSAEIIKEKGPIEILKAVTL